MKFSVCVVPFVAGLAIAAPLAGKAALDSSITVRRGEGIEERNVVPATQNVERGLLFAPTAEDEDTGTESVVERGLLFAPIAEDDADSEDVEERGLLFAPTAEDEEDAGAESVEERGLLFTPTAEDNETDGSEE